MALRGRLGTTEKYKRHFSQVSVVFIIMEASDVVWLVMPSNNIHELYFEVDAIEKFITIKRDINIKL